MQRLLTIPFIAGCVFCLAGCDPASPTKLPVKDTAKTGVTAPLAPNANLLPDNGSSEVPFKMSADTLVPLVRLQPGNNDVFREYGIEFMGHCYECDMADIHITNSTIYFTNGCYGKAKLQLPIEQVSNSGDTLMINAGAWLFNFIKLSDAPVYKLNIFGEPFKKRNLRLGKFFTFKSILHKFEVHDCGEFDG